MNGPLQRLFARGATLLGGTSAAMAATVLQTLLIARGLGPEGFGVWASLQAFASISGNLLTFRTNEPLTRYLVQYRQEGDHQRLRWLLGTALAVDVVTGLAAVVVVALAGPLVAGSLPGGTAVAALYPLVGLALVRTLLDHVWFSVARDLGRFGAIARLNGLFPLLRLGATAALWLAGSLTLGALAWAMALLALLQLGLMGVALRRALRQGYGLPLAGLVGRQLLHCQQALAPFWSFMKATFLWSLFSGLVKEGDVLLLGLLRPAEEVGWYRLAKSLTGVAQQVVELLAQVIYQDFSEQVARRDRAGVRRQVALLAGSWLPLVLVLAGVGGWLAEPLLPALFGADYRPAVTVFQLLLGGAAVVAALFWLRPLALAYELHWYNFRVVVIGTVVFFPLDLMLIRLAGVDGAAAASSLLAAAGTLALLPPVLARLRTGAPPA